MHRFAASGQFSISQKLKDPMFTAYKYKTLHFLLLHNWKPYWLLYALLFFFLESDELAILKLLSQT